eukprot:6193353-Pleurochrysis_carterae.AAC.2
MGSASAFTRFRAYALTCSTEAACVANVVGFACVASARVPAIAGARLRDHVPTHAIGVWGRAQRSEQSAGTQVSVRVASWSSVARCAE